MKQVRVLGTVAFVLTGALAALPSCKSNVITSSTAQGSTVDGPDGVSVRLPAGAVPAGVVVTVKEATPGSYPTDKTNFFTKVYEFKPHGTKFNSAVTVLFPTPAGKDVMSASIWKAELGGKWVQMPQTAPDGDKLAADTDGFSFFAVAGNDLATSCPPEIPCGDGGFPGMPDGAIPPGVDGAPVGNACDGSPYKSDPTLVPGTAKVSGTPDPFVANLVSVSLKDLTHVCAMQAQGGNLVLEFTTSAEYCQGLKGGLIVSSTEHPLQIVISNWSQSAGPDYYNFAMVGPDAYAAPQGQGASPMCNSTASPLAGPGIMPDGGGQADPAVTITSYASGKLTGTFALTTLNGSAMLSGSFTDAPIFAEPTNYCCQN